MDPHQPFIDTIAEHPDDDAPRLVYSDWLEQHGECELAAVLRERAAPVKPVVEITLEDLLTSYDWAEVFADDSSGNTTKKTDACPPGSAVDLTEPTRADVAEIIAAVNGERDEDDWVGVFLLKDGRYLLASGGCDYTGWD